ncbi:MAG TPA: phage terminase large subunit [Candidatus Paceibacterota bacterium]
MKLENYETLMSWIRRNRFLRKKLARLSHTMFFVIYFHGYMKYKTADFQREIFRITEDSKTKMAVISAFRGSAKSTICGMSFPIWAMISDKARFIVLASQTRNQARQQLKNIREEFENNPLLKNDFGPFAPEADEWGAFALNFTNYGTRIIAVSTEQAVRGIRHREHRPDLIILDDIEDLDSTRTKEARDKAWQWFTSEIVPLGNPQTRIFVLGNFLHDFSLVGRLIAQMKTGVRDGIWKRYPLVDENGVPSWPGMFPSEKEVEDLRRTVGDEVAWKREYMLEVIADDLQVIQPEWIKRYYELPEDAPHTIFISADLAISEKETADYTAIVIGYIYGYGKDITVYLQPYPVRKHLSFPKTVETLQDLYDQQQRVCSNIIILIEDVGYQKAAIQELENRRFPVKGMPVQGDKRSRLMTASSFFQAGRVLFPASGVDDLTTEILGFGRERHDDLVDATTMLLLSLVMDRPGIPTIGWLDLMTMKVSWGGGDSYAETHDKLMGSMHDVAERILYKDSDSGNEPLASPPPSSWGGGGSSSSSGPGIHIPPPSGGRSSGGGGDFMGRWSRGDFLKR